MSSPKFNPSPATLGFREECNKHQTSEICMEIAQALQNDLSKFDGSKEMYNSFLGKYIDYLKIKVEINNYKHISISKFNRCVFFDYSFLDDVITNEYNLVKNIENVKKVISMFDRYTKFTKENMALYNVYNKFLYEDLFASIAPYYQLLIIELSNYQSMRKELVSNLTNNIDSLKNDIRTIERIDTNLDEISSNEYRALSKLNILQPVIKFNTQLEGLNKTIISNLRNNILKTLELLIEQNSLRLTSQNKLEKVKHG